MNRHFFLLALLLACPVTAFDFSLPAPVRAGKDVALFFATSSYKHNSSWSNLYAPVKDAREIAADLHDLYGFDTLVVANPTKDQIRNMLATYAQRSYAADGQLLVYFSGHGQYLDVSKDGYYIPSDGKPSKEDKWGDSWMKYTDLRRTISGIPCPHILLAVDACFSGTLDENIVYGKMGENDDNNRKGESEAIRNRRIQDMLRPKTRLFITSGAKEYVPDPSEFAQQFIAGLRTRGGDDGLMDVHELFHAYLKKTSSRPVLRGFEQDENSSTFIFDYHIRTSRQSEPPKPGQESSTGQGQGTTPEPVRDNLVLVRAGGFEMGDIMGDNEKKDEGLHTVHLAGFYLGKTEVTFEEFDAFCAATGKEKPSDNGWGRGKRPAINVSWLDAVTYCNWLSAKNGLSQVYSINGAKVTANWSANGYRLPSEAEWEYAARAMPDPSTGKAKGGGKVRFGNGKDMANPTEFNYDGSEAGQKAYSQIGDSRGQTMPVGTFDPNPLGLYDMAGNVWEWCWDWYDPSFYSKSPKSNPHGPETGANHVRRGGSWNNAPANARVSRRYWGMYQQNYSLGFRVARNQ